MKNNLWKELLLIHGLSTTSGLLMGWNAKWLGINNYWSSFITIGTFFIVALFSIKFIEFYEKTKKYDVDLGKRELFFEGKINSINSAKLFFDLRHLNKINQEPIKLFIDSEGGEVNGLRVIANAIKNSKAPVIGIVIGIAYSGAEIFLQCCHKRLSYPHTRQMLHQIQQQYAFTIKNGGNAHTNIKNSFKTLLCIKKELLKDQKELNKIVMEKSGLTLEQLQEIEEKQLTAEEALKLNLIDEIVTEI